MLDLQKIREGSTLLFNKPKAWTSFDVVKKVRNIVKVKKVGHAGTLDPLATGLLILCTGKYTKQISSIQDQEKQYIVTFKLGAQTASYDAEEPEMNITDASHITEEEVKACLTSFEGSIDQIPPAYSAVKVNGKRAYKAARAGEKVELKARTIRIYECTLLQYQGPTSITALVRCSKGTYIRTLVHDVGLRLKVGAYMTDLVRTHIGNFQLEDAWEISTFEQAWKEALAREQEA